MFVGILQKHRPARLRSPDDGGSGAAGGGAAGSGAGDDSDGQGADGGADGSGSGGDGGADGDQGQGGAGSDEPTYEQLTAQSKELSDKAEELRRSKLTDEERAAEDASRAADTVPEEYADFTMPEGMPADEQLLNDFKPVAKELGLSQGKAQKLIDLYGGKVAPLMAQRQQDAWNGQLEAWVAECKGDKEIGGDKFDAAVSDAQRVINTVGTPELKKVFDDYGLGNNPELVRVFSRMAKYLGEDSIITGGRGGQDTPIHQRLYPNLPG